MSGVVAHLSVRRRGPFGGELLTSLCGRLRTQSDGMNLTDEVGAVTCQLCLRRIAARAARPQARPPTGPQ